MTNEQIESALASLSGMLTDVTKEVVALVKAQVNLAPEHRLRVFRDIDALQARVDALRTSLPSGAQTTHPPSSGSEPT